MITTKKLLLTMIPAIAVVCVAVLVRTLQFQNAKSLSIVSTGQTQSLPLIPIFSDDILLGDIRAPKTLIVFEDLGCIDCAFDFELLETLQATYPKEVKIIWKELSITQFPMSSRRAHEYAYCAHKQKAFPLFAKLSFENQNNLSEDILQTIATETKLNTRKLTSCLESQELSTYTNNTKVLAKSLNIQSVPTAFLENTQIQLPDSIAGFEALLELTK